jgi:hypothetical protein
MMKRLVVAALFLLPGIARADYLDKGDDLWNICTDNAPGHKYLCIGMSTAYFDMMLATGYRCTVMATDRDQLRDAVLKYLAENPGMRSQPASELALTSLKAAFQCVPPAPPQAASPAPRSGKPQPKGAPIQLTPIH